MEQKQKQKKNRKEKREKRKDFPLATFVSFFLPCCGRSCINKVHHLRSVVLFTLCIANLLLHFSVCVCCIPSTTFFRLRQIDTSTYSSPPSLPNRKQIRWSEIELVACLRNWLPTSSPFLFLIWTTAKACMGFYTRPSHRGQDNLRECYGPGLPEANKIPVGRT